MLKKSKNTKNKSGNVTKPKKASGVTQASKLKDDRWVVLKGLEKSMVWDGIGYMHMGESEVNFFTGEDQGFKRRNDCAHCVVQLVINKFLSPKDSLDLFQNLDMFLTYKCSYRLDLIHAKAYYLLIIENESSGKEVKSLSELQKEISEEFGGLLEILLKDQWKKISIDRWRGDEIDQYESI